MSLISLHLGKLGNFLNINKVVIITEFGSPNLVIFSLNLYFLLRYVVTGGKLPLLCVRECLNSMRNN